MHWYDGLLKTEIGEMNLRSPIIISSGVWPYDRQMWEPSALEGTGAVCTKAVTLLPREGNSGTRVWETPSGMLNSIGLQNSGVDSFINDYLPVVSDADVPFVVNVAAERSMETESTLRKLEKYRDIIPCVELNISCPNVDGGGMAWGIYPEGTREVVEIARRSWKGPLWVKLTPQAPDIGSVGLAAQEAGADALVAGNTWLGMDIDINNAKPVFERTFAGLSGPAVFPLALRVVWDLCSVVDIPVIGCGGVADHRNCIAMIMAGASAVETGTSMFVDLDTPAMMCRGIEKYLSDSGLSSISEIKGSARRQ